MGKHLFIVLVCLGVEFIYPVPAQTKYILNHKCFHFWSKGQPQSLLLTSDSASSMKKDMAEAAAPRVPDFTPIPHIYIYRYSWYYTLYTIYLIVYRYTLYRYLIYIYMYVYCGDISKVYTCLYSITCIYVYLIYVRFIDVWSMTDI